jgi:hypothetical protein
VHAAVRGRRAESVSTVARGTFSVEMTPEAEPLAVDGVGLGHLLLSKRFEGDLTGTSQGRMLTATTPVRGCAGYVAIERVTGTLHGRTGTFVLQHAGTMHGGNQQLSITVVPASGTGALAGITGTFGLRIADGTHHYDFEYSLPGP